MNASWRTVRVFISSTFRDMQAERDHLVRFVFPGLREELLKRRIHLVDVDLRWGITSEQDASTVCREVIDECRPRFVCLLGERYGWVPPGQDQSITADEVHYGVLRREPAQRGFTYFYFRDPTTTAAMVEQCPGEYREPAGSPNAWRLAELKAAITHHGLCPKVYSATWHSEQRCLVGLGELGRLVRADLLAGIDAEYGSEAAPSLDEFEEENAAIESFVEERTHQFVLGSRKAVQDELLQHVAASERNSVMCLVGAPGAGKSALLAHLSRHPALAPQPALVFFRHFAGASARSNDVHFMLRRLGRTLIDGAGLAIELPGDLETLRRALPEFLAQASAHRRVVILLDAVDQFDESPPGLSWLPDELPPMVRLILTSVAGPTLESLRRRRHPPREVTLPALSPGDAQAIVDGFLTRYGKTLTLQQRATLLGKTDACTPLYLLAALEELRTLGTFEEITRRIHQLPPSTHALFAWILQRLEEDSGFRDVNGRSIGRQLVRSFGAFLSASRDGLSQRELADLLAPGTDNGASSVVSDALGNVAALLQLLRPYLMRRGELLDFYHRQFREAVEQISLQSADQRRKAHQELADYFLRLADPDHDRRWHGASARPFVALPFHLQRNNDERLQQLLWDPRWYHAKLARAGVYGLAQDLGLVPADRELQLVRSALSLALLVVQRDPTQLASQLIGRLLFCQEARIRSFLTALAEAQEAPWFRPLVPSLAPAGGSLLRTLHGHTLTVDAVAVTTDRRAVSGSMDNMVKVWDLSDGRCLRTLAGHTDWVSAIAVSRDGTIVSGSKDHTIRLWCLETGRCLRTLRGHRDWVVAVALTEGGWVVSAAQDHTLQVWDRETGTPTRLLTGHTGHVNALAALGNRIISASDDHTLKVWDVESGRCLHTLEGHTDRVLAVAVTRQRLAVSASRDGTIRIWNPATGLRVGVFPGPRPWVSAIAVTADGRLVCGSRNERPDYPGCGDRSVTLWSLGNGKCLGTFNGHVDWVAAVAVTDDGMAVSACDDATLNVWDVNAAPIPDLPHGHRKIVHALFTLQDGRAISASDDFTIKVWELETGRCQLTLEGHTGWVRDVKATPDGRIVSASEDGTIRIWESQTGRCLGTCRGDNAGCRAVALTGDGKIVSVGYTVKIWDLETCECLRTIEARAPCTSPLIIPARGQAVTASEGDTLTVWDIHTAECSRILRGHTGAIHALTVSADGRLVSGSADHTLRVWDVRSGRCLQVLEGHTDVVAALAITGDGRVLSASYDATLKVWDLNSGQNLCTLAGHALGVVDVAVAPDNTVFSASWDGTLKAWDIRSGRTLATFSGPTSIGRCAVAADCRTVVAADQDGGMHFLRLTTPGTPNAALRAC